MILQHGRASVGSRLVGHATCIAAGFYHRCGWIPAGSALPVAAQVHLIRSTSPTTPTPRAGPTHSTQFAVGTHRVRLPGPFDYSSFPAPAVAPHAAYVFWFQHT